MSEITINIKCSNADKASVKIEKSATIAELKERIATELNVPAAQQRLIYKGRVLKDELSVEHYDIQDTHTVHMVRGGGAAAAAAATTSVNTAATSNTNTSTTTQPLAANTIPNPTNPFANPLMGMGMGMGAGAGGNNFGRMQQQLMQNPEIMQQIMNSPMMDNLLNNPDMLRNMMLNNPQMQAMLDANPHVRHILNDPAVSFVLLIII